MDIKQLYISNCLPICLCKDKSKLKYIGRKWVRSRIQNHYEYVYTDGKDYYRSSKLLEDK